MKFVVMVAALTLAISGCAGGSKKADKEMKSEAAEKSSEMKEDGKKAMEEKASSASSMSKTECAMKNDKRVVDVRKNGKGCELAYSKFGNEEIVATSMSGTDHCEKIAERISNNLENAGFKCER